MSAFIWPEWREERISTCASVKNAPVGDPAVPLSAIGVAAASICAALILAFQLGFLPLFQPLFAGDDVVWPAVYYGFWALALIVTGVVLATRPEIRRRSAPVLLVCGFSIALVFLHPVDWVAKNYLVAMVLAASLVVLALGSAPLLLLRFSVSCTALNAVGCLLDIMFADGFTNSAGRAAGLSINPNIAAASLLLGVSAGYWLVPRRLRLPLLVLTGAALFATLSRSVMLTSAATVLVTGAAAVWQKTRKGETPRPDWRNVAYSAALAGGLLVWIGVASVTNDRFQVAAIDSAEGLKGAINAFNAASDVVRKAVRDVTERMRDASGNASPAEQSRRAATIQIEELGAAASTIESTNSASARALYFQRSLLAYQTGPFFGAGLEPAHQLKPHNTYLMFAVAFGHLGLLVPLGFIFLTFYMVRDFRLVPLGLATAAVMFISHDVLLLPGLLVPIALGIAGLIAGSDGEQPDRQARKAVGYAAAAATLLFAIAGAAVFATSDTRMAVRLQNADTRRSFDNAYFAHIPRTPFPGLLRVADVALEDSPGDRLFLRENGTVIAESQSPERTVEDEGAGRYYIYKRYTLVFSSSDNSDPRWNGRRYDIDVPVTAHPLLFLMLGASLIWCIGVVRAGFRPSMKET